jgi:hypothetical protein
MNVNVSRLLKELIAQITFFIATLKTRTKTFFHYRISKKFYQFKVVKTLEKLSTNGLAIVALYPKAETLKSVNRLIDSLVISNYSVLVVINQSHFSDKFLLSLSTKPIEILTRPNLGRDFGAHKIGFLHAEKSGYLEDIDNLLFANDSMVYGPESIGFVNSMLKVDVPWNAMFVNFDLQIHAQSFFQIFEKVIFEQPFFSEYWHKYYPHDLRHNVINKGEKGLSQSCLRSGFSPISYVSAEAILKHPEFVDFTPDEKFALILGNLNTFANSDHLKFDNLLFLMRRQYLIYNITHYQGLLASRVIKAPIKRDIVSSGLVTIDGLRDTLTSLGLEQDELKDVLRVMLLQPISSRFEKFWNSFGYRL